MFCRSEQLFEQDGKTLEYSFKTPGDKYLCVFLTSGKFEVSEIGIDATHNKVVLRLDFIPHNLRPDNTTEERIKALIVFS